MMSDVEADPFAFNSGISVMKVDSHDLKYTSQRDFYLNDVRYWHQWVEMVTTDIIHKIAQENDLFSLLLPAQKTKTYLDQTIRAESTTLNHLIGLFSSDDSIDHTISS